MIQNRVPDKSQATLFMAGIDSVAKSSASFKDETDLKAVLAKDFSIEPEASLANRALAAAFVVAWRAAHDSYQGHEDIGHITFAANRCSCDNHEGASAKKQSFAILLCNARPG